MSYFDDNEDRIIYGPGRRVRSAPREITCRECGRSDLYWHPLPTGGKFQLTNPDGRPHTCGADADEFEDVA